MEKSSKVSEMRKSKFQKLSDKLMQNQKLFRLLAVAVLLSFIFYRANIYFQETNEFFVLEWIYSLIFIIIIISNKYSIKLLEQISSRSVDSTNDLDGGTDIALRPHWSNFYNLNRRIPILVYVRRAIIIILLILLYFHIRLYYYDGVEVTFYPPFLKPIGSKSTTVILNFPSLLRTTLIWGSIFLSLAVGLNLAYKILGFPNFAQAEMLTIGSYTGLYIQTISIFQSGSANNPAGSLSNQLLLVSIIAGFFVSGIFAIIIDKLIYKKLREKNSKPETMMITSLGVAFLIRGLLLIRFTGSAQYYQPVQEINSQQWEIVKTRFEIPLGGNILNIFNAKFADNFKSTGLNTYPIDSFDVILILTINLMILVTFLFIQYSKIGKAMRAVSDDPSLAAASGINVERIRTITWFISGGLAGSAGVLLAAKFPFRPELGTFILLAAFAVIVMGTIGSFSGTVIAAYILGFSRSLSISITASLGGPLDKPQFSTVSEIVPFMILLVVLLFYPEGIGKTLQDNRIKKMHKRMEELEGESIE